MSNAVPASMLSVNAGVYPGGAASRFTQGQRASSYSSSSSSDYRIAVPSYDRVDILQRDTLASLEACGIDCSKAVDVFVADEQEADKYDRGLLRGTYASIKVGVLGIGKQRDFILDHYGPDNHVVMVDDDIQFFKHCYPGPIDLHRVISKGFQLSQHHGCFMWGLNNSSNSFYMRPRYSVGWLFFQVGPSHSTAVFLLCEWHMQSLDVFAFLFPSEGNMACMAYPPLQMQKKAVTA